VIPDVRQMDPAARFSAAMAIRPMKDIAGWPALAGWNDQPCERHPGPVRGCLQCGVILGGHQRVGAAWLYFAGTGLLGDSTGTGKTAQLAALIAMCRETGELGRHSRVVLICQPVVIGQWRDELRRMLPGLAVITADGTPAQRVSAYLSDWEVAILGPRTLAPARGDKCSRGGDVERLENFPIGLLAYDDLDEMRERANRTAYAIRRLAARAGRVVALHATPVQKRLLELYSVLEPVGGAVTFGTQRQYKHRYVEMGRVWYTALDQAGRKVIKTREREMGIKPERGPELRGLLAPLVLRRKAGDIQDVRMPEVVPHVVWLEPSPGQRARYAELRAGVLRRIREEGESVSRPVAVAHFMHGWQICSGLATLDEGRDDSVKLDWTMNALTGDLAEEKAVVFVNFKPNVAALSARLAAEGVEHVLMWGSEQDKAERAARLARFRDDPACRVLIGTTTIERSLNLQAARHLIAVDTILNPMRMTQLVGRIRRQGGAYDTVYLHQLLLRGTQEEGYLPQLQQEQATVDAVWGEHGELFQGSVQPLDLLRMIAGRAA
jgi:SNF2 family DNA or RNA helicase